jgi:hypothetical protein
VKTSPFKIVYGRELSSVRAYTTGDAKLSAVHHQLKEQDEFLAETRERLEQAQNHYKLYYDCKHREVEFQVGQWVWLQLISRPLASLDVRDRSKLAPKYFKPFKVVKRIGTIAYKLQLPASAKIHDVFHVGLLKAYRSEESTAPGSLPPVRHGRACLEPSNVLKSRMARGQLELLVSWTGQVASEATWIPTDEFRTLYPSYQLEDELLLQGGKSCTAGTDPGGSSQGPWPPCALSFLN